MSKTYDYKSLIDSYIKIPERDYLHQDFRVYWEGLVRKLEELLGISINPEKRPVSPEVFIYSSIHSFTLWKLFEITVASIRRTRAVGVTGSWLEGGPESSLYRMQEKSSSELVTKIQASIHELHKLETETTKARYQLLYQLIELFFGKIDKIITSEELLAAGFDDSKEPQIRDYHNYI